MESSLRSPRNARLPKARVWVGYLPHDRSWLNLGLLANGFTKGSDREMSSYRRKIKIRPVFLAQPPVGLEVVPIDVHRTVRYRGDSYLPRLCQRCRSAYFELLPVTEDSCPWCRGEISASAQDHLIAEIEAEGVFADAS